MSFKAKLIFSYVFIIFIAFGITGFFLDRNLEKNSLRDIQSSLLNQAQLIEAQISSGNLIKEGSASLEAFVKAMSAKIKSRITIIDKQGKVLAESEKSQAEISNMENHLYRPEVRDALGGVIGIDTRYSSTLKIDMLYVAVPLVDNRIVVGVLRLALPLQSVQRMLSETRRVLFLGLFFALVLAFVLGSIVAAQISQPIHRMIQVSRQYAQGDFSRKIIRGSRDELGELALTLNKMSQDIEDKIREIKTQNQKLSAVLNSMMEGVIVVDKTGHIISVNQTIEKIFGILKEDTQDKLFLEAIRNKEISEVINKVLKEKLPLSGEINPVLPVRGIFQLNAVPIFDNNIISGCLVVIHDITEIRRLETVRRDFVANVSHELKTPLTSINGFVETLLEGAMDDKENNKNFLKIIHDHTQRLNSLVDDLLSLSHMESKEIRLENKSFNLHDEAEKVIQGFRSQLKKRNIEIYNEIPAHISMTADKDRIEQVLTNLIDNAIKFNKEKGSIRIYSQEKDKHIKVTVEDSGIGIPEKDISRIFERFYRVDKARSRELGGTGLGLSIVKHIVELHKGSVGVESTEGLRSKFWFSLPQ